ncbi:MAG: DUF2306 domain-containing protein [Pirellulaceae bacterium]|nr:DUF2306 domain-containing protein [Pirellulaceae bacterium]
MAVDPVRDELRSFASAESPTTPQMQRVDLLKRIAIAAVAVLFAEVFFEILNEYRWYFPANFDESDFLIGRRPTFIGLYRVAFYTHIIAAPVALLTGCFLMFTGGKTSLRRIHRAVGRIQLTIVVFAVAPSGLVMATQAYTGAIAAWGFATHSSATALCAVIAVFQARRRSFRSHRQWATRCFLLLCAPLMLRLISGAAIITNHESDLTYQLNAWCSWILLLIAYEAYLHYQARPNHSAIDTNITATLNETVR